MNSKPVRPQKVAKKPLPPVSKPEPLVTPEEVAKPVNTNKYARKEKLTTVGLRNLKVTHN
tara:strand:- start:307 stop:486 length:180 start_codon:yes stop_codon:yes gene_type:complete